MPHANVALLGFGNVGRAFLRYIKDPAVTPSIQIRIRAIADSTGGIFFDDESPLDHLIAFKESGGRVSDFTLGKPIAETRDFIRELQPSGVSVLVESLPTNIAGGEPALTLVKTALEQGTSVVTVDKGPVVHGLEALREAASKSGARIGYSGTTGVSIPDDLANERVLEIRGVLNGTTNYVLSEMQERGRSFDDAIATAQAEGIAEPDPSLDVQGWDTAAKILILAKSLMNAQSQLAEVSRIGIGPETDSLIRIAKESGRVVRLVGRARIWQGRVRVSVAPKLIAPDSPFYSVSGTSKAAVFRTEARGEVLAAERSGRDAISRTILDDIVKLAAE